jgi:hypothetical protein
VAWLAGLAALVVAAGCMLAVVAPDRRFSVLGLTVALVAAPLVAVQRPDLLSLAFRETAALTGAYLLWVVSRDRPAETGGTLPAFAGVFVALAFAGGLALAPALGDERGAAVGLAAASAAAMAALALTLGTRMVLSNGLGAILLVLAASLAVTGLTSTGGPLDHAITGAALLAVTTAAAFLGSGAPEPVDAPPP